MRTKTIARWRRAALAGTLAATLAAPMGARAQTQEKGDAAPAPAAQEQQAQPPAAQDQQAQQPADKEPAQPAQKPENAPVVTEQSPRPPPDGNIQPVPGAPEQYTIQKGDTLWDLSQKFLNNPWYWPKIWSLNPSIENPHWIYPGNTLRIVPGQGGAQAPAQVEAPPEQGVDATAANSAAEPQEPAETQETQTVTPPASPDLQVVNRNSPNRSTGSVSVSGKLAFTPPPVLTVRASGMVSPEEMSQAGKLDASFEEKEMLTNYDTAYVDFKGEVPVKPGDKLIIFHPEDDIVDPVSHKKLGQQVKTTGVAKVLAVNGSQATVQIERTFEEIQRGDRVRPWTPQDKRITPRANTADVSGVIVQALNAGLTTIGESNEVFIDKGSADGVQEGNTFAVVRHGDGLAGTVSSDSKLYGASGAGSGKVQVPDENVGLLLVVDAKEHISTAIVVKSVRELTPGDTVEMHPAGSGGGAL